MPVVEEIIRVENDGTVSFGNYVATEKKKVSNFEVDGNIYNVKTHDKITRLEKNSKLLIETVPGSAIHCLSLSDYTLAFSIEGFEDTQITTELEPDCEYVITVNDFDIGSMKSNLSGKINFSIELNETPQCVRIQKA